MDLLSIERGSVVAPAGCGKTELIAAALKQHRGRLPILVLTHTNAGAAALRARTARDGVSPRAFRVSTIDGWAMRLISTFPARSGHDPLVLGAKPDYPLIRAAADALIRSGHLCDILASTYERVVIDEYQDCSRLQHSLAVGLADVLPTAVLGDPMQAIFDFADDDPIVDWDGQALRAFPEAHTLRKPWRWINAGAEPLGHWLLDARERLATGLRPDLRGVRGVEWVRLDGGAEDHRKRLGACNTRAPENGRVLIIGHGQKASVRHGFASRAHRAVTVEGVELRDLMRFAACLDFGSPDATDTILAFAASVMTGVGQGAFLKRLGTLRSGRQRSAPSDAEAAALTFERDRHPQAAAELLMRIAGQPDVRVYRPTIHQACLQALRHCPDGDFRASVVRVREANRHLGRELPRRAVGSTLLLKGLEADVAVVLDADELSPKNLYVAFTRGARRLVVCSRHAEPGRRSGG
ncbi:MULTISPECIES: UvrD-helicase domain-containing protein [Aureimonas]|uniref:DNA helicase-2 / ATP-dependent DNA helicase PcrA n=2 Tax=Aureimonas TaxID=414371 RepID=A0A1H0HG32_9HYPH|nr:MULTISPECIES: UvrD-helicase domain-containing protein [Aureimonas]MBB3934616.1 DNA helicase-2/ATP-dependent DNA helicase PcrA [Aureimonas phyllosphaerae]MBB3950573.1 DNA helicase-2/ATP-dependent DNA helicase PcrA [Aureimonas jatrophae]MBB3958168.1 DNA helicase-2/ATP-dependent DNA helicase PcrA [Aureimonas phyllosphaerae]SDO18077.1 DNA helicase-2 / ATP-dependent DNA helicase PcrA [Aureimonas jatrophae]SFE92883.1 DNA helicase-2 / ATP-dependent DNA helicase PcrA [Aureimonas phyllosphaerae]